MNTNSNRFPSLFLSEHPESETTHSQTLLLRNVKLPIIEKILNTDYHCMHHTQG